MPSVYKDTGAERMRKLKEEQFEKDQRLKD
jgi:hypothetical protein